MYSTSKLLAWTCDAPTIPLRQYYRRRGVARSISRQGFSATTPLPFVKSCEYTLLIPDRPYCTDRLGKLLVRKVEKAVTFPHIQPNWPEKKLWLLFDVDCVDAWLRWEDSGLPYPTYIAVNKTNGHAHIGYLLETPVSFFEDASEKAKAYYKAVERAFCRRLGADRSYSGFLTKNPIHSDWDVDWNSDRGYPLAELNDVLESEDKRWFPKNSEAVEGFGRNDSLFDATRKFAYRHVLKYKKESKTEESFMEFLVSYALVENQLFSSPLWMPEVRGIVRSVARFVWARFTLEKFSALQSYRGKKAWSKAFSLSKAKPWESEGICRRTWERRRASTRLLPDMEVATQGEKRIFARN